jgi:hypothetical protein
VTKRLIHTGKGVIVQSYRYLLFLSIISIVLLLVSTSAYGEVLDFGRSRISVEIPANFEPVQFDSNESQTRMRWLDDSTNSYLTIVSEYGSPSLPISLVTGNLTFHIVSQLILRSTYL